MLSLHLVAHQLRRPLLPTAYPTPDTLFQLRNSDDTPIGSVLTLITPTKVYQKSILVVGVHALPYDTITLFEGQLGEGCFQISVPVLIVTHDQPAQNTAQYNMWLSCVWYLPFGEIQSGVKATNVRTIGFQSRMASEVTHFLQYNITIPLHLKIDFSFSELSSSRCSMHRPYPLSQGRAISIYCTRQSSVISTSPAQPGGHNLTSNSHLWRTCWQMAILLTPCVWQNALYIVTVNGKPSADQIENSENKLCSQPQIAFSPSTIPPQIFYPQILTEHHEDHTWRFPRRRERRWWLA